MFGQEYFCINKINGETCRNATEPLGFICERCFNNGMFGEIPLTLPQTITVQQRPRECMYQTHLTSLKGEYCKRPPVEGSEFCRNCILKQAATFQIATSINNLPTIQNKPIIQNKPAIQTRPTIQNKPTTQDKPTLILKPVCHMLRRNGNNIESKLYREATHGFLIDINRNQQVNTFGYTNHHDDINILPLTSEKATIASSLGFNIFMFE